MLHREIYHQIVTRGYRAIPEFDVAGRRIDILIEGKTAQLAVECDGDSFHGPDKFLHDLNRQMVLERAGFTFWRIRYSEFNRDRVGSLQPLWDQLDKMAIGVGGTDRKKDKTGGGHDTPKTDKEQSHPPRKAPKCGNPRATVKMAESTVKRSSTRMSDRRQPKYSHGVVENERLKPVLTAILGRDRTPASSTAQEIQRAIIEILSEASNHSYIKDKVHIAILRKFSILTRGKPKEEFRRRVNLNIGRLKRSGNITEYKARNIRIRLVHDPENFLF